MSLKIIVFCEVPIVDILHIDTLIFYWVNKYIAIPSLNPANSLKIPARISQDRRHRGSCQDLFKIFAYVLLRQTKAHFNAFLCWKNAKKPIFIFEKKYFRGVFVFELAVFFEKNFSWKRKKAYILTRRNALFYRFCLSG